MRKFHLSFDKVGKYENNKKINVIDNSDIIHCN